MADLCHLGPSGGAAARRPSIWTSKKRAIHSARNWCLMPHEIGRSPRFGHKQKGEGKIKLPLLGFSCILNLAASTVESFSSLNSKLPATTPSDRPTDPSKVQCTHAPPPHRSFATHEGGGVAHFTFPPSKLSPRSLARASARRPPKCTALSVS